MQSSPRSGRTFAASVTAVAVALVVVVIGVSTLRSAGADGDRVDTAAPAAPVPVLTARYSDATEIEARYPALITARRQSALGFPSGGRLAVISADLGDRVPVGQVLARLDTRALEAQRQAARADLVAARAEAELAVVTLNRQRQLVEQGHVSPQALDEANARAAAAQARIEAATAAEAALAVQIDLASLSAPFDGVITARHFDEGASVGAGAPVLTLVEANALELRVGLPEADARRLRPGGVYQAETEAGPTLTVTLRAVTEVIDPRDRSISAVFDVPPGVTIASGAVARLVLPHTLEERGFWAPVAALSEGRRGLWSVYVLAADGEAFILEPRPVEILHTERDQVYVRGAVDDGDALLAGGVHRVAPGQRVRPAREG